VPLQAASRLASFAARWSRMWSAMVEPV